VAALNFDASRFPQRRSMPPRQYDNEKDPERARSALLVLDAGCSRDEWARYAAAFKAAGGAFEDFDSWSSTAGNYAGTADCRAVWKSFQEDGGIKAGTLFGAARAAGWSDGSTAPAANAHRPIARQQTAMAAKPAGPDPLVIWNECEPAPAEHGYIVRKGGKPDGLKVYPVDAPPLTIAGCDMRGCLVVPAYDLQTGELLTLQFIPPGEGKKLNLPGRPMAGAFTVPATAQGSCTYIVEGIGQAWSAAAATGGAAVVAFGAGNMEKAAKALIATGKPARSLVLVADVGKADKCRQMAETLGCGWVAAPDALGSNGDINDLQQAEGLATVAELLAAAEFAATPKPRFPLLTADELANLPPLRWRIKGVLPESGLAAVYGPSGGGKSFLVLDMLASVADGCEWFEHRVNRAPVVYLALEGEAGLSQRVQAYRLQHGEHACKGMHFMTVPFSLLAAGDVQGLAESIAAAGAAGGVVCIDTLNRAAPGADENSSQDMGLIIEAAKALQMVLGGLVLLVHHTGKDAGKGLRGHSSLFAALDAAIEVSRDGDNRAWAVAKSKDGQDGNQQPFRLEVLELGEDGDGEPVTSCVIAPEEAPAGGKRGCKLPQSAKVALDALKLAQEQHGTPPPATVRDRWGMQAPGVVVTEEQWRDVAYKSGISGSDAPDAKRKAFGRAFQMLQQVEQIRVWDGYVWSLW